MSRPAAERRAHARFPRQFELEGAPGPDGTAARMVASDLSLGGLYCSSASDFAPMTRLAVRLFLPDGSAKPAPLDVEAVVVRRKKLPSVSGGSRFELALFFTAMDDLARQRLARFLARDDA